MSRTATRLEEVIMSALPHQTSPRARAHGRFRQVTIRFSPSEEAMLVLEDRLSVKLSALKRIGLILNPRIVQVIVRDDVRIDRDTFIATFIDISGNRHSVIEVLSGVGGVSSVRAAPLPQVINIALAKARQ